MDNLQSQSFSLREIRTIPEVINATFEFIRLNSKVMLKGLLIYVMPLLLIGECLIQFLRSSDSPILQLFSERARFGNAPGFLGTDNLGLTILLALLVILFVFLSIVLLQAYVFGFVRAYTNAEEQSPDLADVWQQTKDIFWRVFGTNIGLGILAVGGFFIVRVFAFLPLLGAFAILGMLILIPVLITNYILYYPARFIGNESFGEAFLRAKELIVGRWWPTFGFIALGFLFVIVVRIFSLLPDILLHWLEDFGVVSQYQLYNPTSWVSIVRSVLLVLFSTVYQLSMVVPLLGVVVHYYNQVERQDSYALAEDVATIGEAENDL